MAQSSVIGNMLKFVFRRNAKPKRRDISAPEAVNLQKQYIADFCAAGALYTEPYVEIAKQLLSPQDEVFRAAVYYLQKIAQNQPDTVEPIVALLESCAAQNLRSEADKTLLRQAIDEITRLPTV